MDESSFATGQKAPNQLFEKLEKKLQVRNKTACSSRKGEEGTQRDAASQKQLKSMIQRIKAEIKAVTTKLAAERNITEQPNSYKKYYSFAVRYLY